MTPTRLPPPHDSLLDVAEAMSLAGFESLASAAQATNRRSRSNGSSNGSAPPESAGASRRIRAAVRTEGSFEALNEWLRDADPSLPLRHIEDGLLLEPEETALLALLFAAAASEHVALHVAASSNAGGRGVPVWLAQRLIPGLRTDSLTAAGALRRFGLVGIEADALRIEARVWLREPVLDRFCGAPAAEPEVEARVAPAIVNAALANDTFARHLKAALTDRGRDHLSPLVMVGRGERAMVTATIAELGLRPHLMSAGTIPDDPEARDHLARMWSRDAALDGAALVLIADEGTAARTLADFVDRIAGHVILVGDRPNAELRREVRIFGEATAPSATPAERWRRQLGPARTEKLGSGLSRVAAHFRLSPTEIEAVCAMTGSEIDSAPDSRAAASVLWHAAARMSPTESVPGVSVVEPSYTWDDIVLARPIEAALRRVEMHVRHATTVLDDWGFGERMGGRGRGVAALFAGPSGTGKTMAAEVLASSLDLRMMVIDLSQIISKYVGETSKNIAAAFEQAERTGAVMVWNEGDAIWGARGAVGNATDRHINAEIGDLLQRIEAFRGFTIVTTNIRKAIDPAFLRRFRFAIDFPMPSENERLRLWAQVFPKAAPVEAIDWSALAALPLSGGSIRNVALGSAFLAAEDGGRIDSQRIAAELAEELQKHDQPMPTINFGQHG
jgi:hypothetical protein